VPKISQLAAIAALSNDDYLLVVDTPGGAATTRRITAANAATFFGTGDQVIEYAISPEDVDATSGTSKVVVRAPYDLTLTEVRLSASVASASGTPTVDINAAATSILSTKLTLDVGERTSTTAATPAVISTAEIPDDTEIAFDIDNAGTGTRGLKVKLVHTRGIAVSTDISIVGETHTSYTTRTNTTVAAHSSAATGDTVLVGIITGASGGNAPDPTPPGGLTILPGTWPITATDGGFTIEMRVYRTVYAGETDYTFTHSSATSQAFTVTATPGDTGTPIDVTPSTNQGTGTTTTATSVTTVTDRAVVVYIAHDWGDTSNSLSVPTSTGVTYTALLNAPLPAPGGLVYIATGMKVAAGATGNATQTSNSGVSGAWGATLVALRPSA